MNLKQKYGSLAVVAGASEGLGAAYCHALAAQGMDIALIARRVGPLEEFATQLRATYQVNTIVIPCDLKDTNAVDQIMTGLAGRPVGVLVYNAALSHIGPHHSVDAVTHTDIVQVNMVTMMNLVHRIGADMLTARRGGIVVMSSIAGHQGAGFLTTYSATKAFCRNFAEGLWYEWQGKGVDIIACCAGATATPNFLNTKPKPASIFAPKVQAPEEVVTECLSKLGTVPSFVTGAGNKIATFFMERIMPRRMAIKIMGDTTRSMYGIDW